MTALAIGLHNVPEGLATFIATLADVKSGAALAVAIAIHNIPEVRAVVLPIPTRTTLNPNLISNAAP